MFFTGMCFCSQAGVWLSACWETPPPQEQATPPGAEPLEQAPPELAPPRSRPPPLQSMLGDTVNARAVRILLECNLVLC